MAEQNQQQQQEEVPDHPQFRQQRKDDEDEGPVTLGDGTVLKESDKPRNPKKKMWEEDVESAKRDQAQAQETQAQQEGSGQRRKRDEL